MPAAIGVFGEYEIVAFGSFAIAFELFVACGIFADGNRVGMDKLVVGPGKQAVLRFKYDYFVDGDARGDFTIRVIVISQNYQDKCNEAGQDKPLACHNRMGLGLKYTQWFAKFKQADCERFPVFGVGIPFFKYAHFVVLFC